MTGGVAGSSSVPSGIVVVNLPREFVNDAIFFLKEAEVLASSGNYDEAMVWRFCRVALVCAHGAFEAYLNQFIKNNACHLLRYAIRKSIKEKLEILSLCKVLRCSINFGRRPWQDFDKLADIRDSLVHYKQDPAIYKYFNPDFVRSSIQVSLAMIRELHAAHGTPVPSWVDQIKV